MRRRAPRSSGGVIGGNTGLGSPAGAPAWGLAVLLAITAAVYAGVMTHPFDYDDFHSLVDNRAVHGFGQFASLWVSPTAVSAEGTRGYRPVLLSLWALQYTVFGLRPQGYHLVNLAAHLGVVALTWRLASMVYRERRAVPVAAALVALHPLHAEAVNYVTAQSSLFTVLLMIGALTLTTQASIRQGEGCAVYCAGALVAVGLALGVKEIAVVFPVLFLLWEWFRSPHSLTPFQRALWALPFVGLVGAFIALRHQVLAGESLFLPASPSLVAVVATTVKIIALSLAAWVWPFRLSVDHGNIVVSADQAWMWLLGAGLAIGAAAAWAIRGRRGPFAALAWSAASIAPVGAAVLLTPIGLFQEHRAYLAGVGLALIIAPSAARAWSRTVGGWRWGVAGLVVILLVTASTAIVWRTSLWADRVALWYDAVVRYPASSPAHAGLVAAYLAAGRIDLAEPALRESVRLDPHDYRTVYALADLLMKMGRWEEGQALNARVVEALIGRAGMALLRGDMQANRGNIDGALAAYREAEALGSRGPELDVRLGSMAERSGRIEEARTFYRRAAAHASAANADVMWSDRARIALSRLDGARSRE